MIGRPERLMPGHLVGATISTMRSYSFLSPVFTVAAFQYISIPMASADQAVAQAPAEISASDSLEDAVSPAKQATQKTRVDNPIKALLPAEQFIPMISLDAHRHFQYRDHPDYDSIKNDMSEAHIQKAFLLSQAYLIDEESKRRFALNRELSEFITAHSGNFFGFCGINIAWDDRDQVLSECLKLPNMIGVKLNFCYRSQRLDTPQIRSRFESILKVAQPYHAVFLMHMFLQADPAGEMAALYKLSQNYPQLTFVIAHLALNGCGDPLFLNTVAQELHDPKSRDNIYTEVSGWHYFDAPPGPVVRFIRDFGIDHVLFGSDSPSYDSGDQVGRVMKLPFTNEERRLILYQNGLDFLQRISRR